MTATTAHANDAGSVSNVSGYVTVTNADGEVKRLKDGDKLNSGDIINTGNDSGVLISLANGETITLGALASYSVGQSDDSGNGAFAQRSLGGNSPTLSTATSAGGGVIEDAPTTPAPGGSPTN